VPLAERAVVQHCLSLVVARKRLAISIALPTLSNAWALIWSSNTIVRLTTRI